ncbi:electron transport complex subunit RsxG [Kistimonas asteriae]|uniref:electron transport complex subunit RsxG n=1 Tax=Kistimonas asteriae TaxID=517724 RepID=UPI001BA9E309|nr:electron transport complex subunit RsxG [Kistimonas asteriae]
MTALFRTISKNSLTLGLFAVLTTGLVALTWYATRDQITSQVRASEEKALHEVLPLSAFDNSLLDTRVILPEPERLGPYVQPPEAYIAFQNDKPSAIILPVVAPDGYSGRINLLVGIYADGRISGVRVITHKETPGLGDSIDTRISDWILGFNGKSINHPAGEGWAVRKDGGEFDQFTGATITPRAVVAAVRRSLDYFADYHSALFTNGLQRLKESPHGQH